MAEERRVRLAVLGAAVLVTIAFGTAFFFAASPGADPLSATYVGARHLAGPGTGALPMIPVRVNEEGNLVGVPTHLDWYSYCRDGMPGLDDRLESTNTFSYSLTPERLRAAKSQGIEVWYEPLLGDELKASDFTQDWQGAHVQWRTPSGSDGIDTMTAILLRVPAGTYDPAIEEEFAPDGFVAFNADDTHFCCQAVWKMDNSPKSKDETGFDLIYGSCHDDIYDPRLIERSDLPPGPDGDRLG